MQRFATTLLMIVLFGSVILWSGCGRSAERIEPKPPPHEEKDVSAEVTDIPEWFLKPPKDTNYLYAATTASGTDLGTAIDSAKLAGQSEIASQMQVKVSSLFKRFNEEVGVGEDATLTAMTAAVSKAVVSEVFSGAREAEKSVKRESSVMWRVYILMEMPIGLANATLVREIKANKSMYTQFRASQAFKELEAEVEKYEQSKKGQGQ